LESVLNIEPNKKPIDCEYEQAFQKIEQEFQKIEDLRNLGERFCNDVQKLINAARSVIKRAEHSVFKAEPNIENAEALDEFLELNEALENVESYLEPERDDPRSMGWVGDDGLP